MEFRHEWKHEISYADLLALRARLAAVMDRDVHAVGGRYEIRSLYFDNLADKALREKIDGVNCREKFRVRCYNGDLSLILLEKKSKVNGLCSKVQAELSPREVRAIAAGDARDLAGSREPLVRELAFKMSTQGLRPRTVCLRAGKRSGHAGSSSPYRHERHGFSESGLRHHPRRGRPGDPGGEVGFLPALSDPGPGTGARHPHRGLFQIRRLPHLRLRDPRPTIEKESIS